MAIAGLLKRPAFWWILFVLAVILGVILIKYGQGLEPYSDSARASKLISAEYCFYESGRNTDIQAKKWYREMGSVRTARYPTINTGCALIVAALTIGILFACLNTFGSISRSLLRTPERKWHFFAIGTAIIFSSCFAIIFGLELDLKRGMFPWCADSIGIPIFGIGFATIILLPIALLIGWLISCFFRDIPVSLWQWDSKSAGRSWSVTIFFGSLSILWLGVLLNAAPTADFLIVGPCILAIYVTLSCRAAVLAPLISCQ
jgi:hypothetical protein